MGSMGKATQPIINREELDSALEKAAKRTWNFRDEDDFVRSIQEQEAENFKSIADDMLQYFKENNLELITPSNDYPEFIQWYYSGRDKSDGQFMSGYTDDYPQKSKLKETLSGNGITERFAFPKNIADYVINETNMTSEEIKVAQILTTQALKEYRNRRKKG